MGIVVDQVLFESFNLAELQFSVAESLCSLNVISGISAVIFDTRRDFLYHCVRPVLVAGHFPYSDATVRTMAPQIAFLGLGSMGQVCLSIIPASLYSNGLSGNRLCART